MKNRQLLAAVTTLILMCALILSGKWPFHQDPVPLGQGPSIWEILLNDRISLGFIRAGLAALVTYAVISVPALVVAGRWMKGLTTAGLTADDAETADRHIEELEQDLQETLEELEDQVRENDILSELLLELDAERGDNHREKGDADGDG